MPIHNKDTSNLVPYDSFFFKEKMLVAKMREQNPLTCGHVEASNERVMGSDLPLADPGKYKKVHVINNIVPPQLCTRT